jgi:hypothetical protein
MMPPLSSLVGKPLTWVPTAVFKSRYDLIAPGNTALASLDMSNWSSKATAQVPEGTLFLHKEGWTGLKVAVYAAEGGPLIATFQRKWTGTSGQLTFSDGRQFKWGKANFWGTKKAWTDPTGGTVYAQLSTGAFSRRCSVVIYPPAAGIPELSLLLVLGLYNIVIDRRNAAAASANQHAV